MSRQVDSLRDFVTGFSRPLDDPRPVPVPRPGVPVARGVVALVAKGRVQGVGAGVRAAGTGREAQTAQCDQASIKAHHRPILQVGIESRQQSNEVDPIAPRTAINEMNCVGPFRNGSLRWCRASVGEPGFDLLEQRLGLLGDLGCGPLGPGVDERLAAKRHG